MAAPFTRRIPKKSTKTMTFTGAAGIGATGTFAVFTCTGSVLITHMGIRCTTLLTSSGGTISMGTADNVDGIIETTLASDIDASEWWQNSTPEVKVSPAIVDLLVCASVIATIATANITAGVLEVVAYWLPMSSDGALA